MYKDDLLLFGKGGSADPRDYQLSSVYALNRIVREFRISLAHSIRPVHEEKVHLVIAAYLYDAATRTFQQMGFKDERWHAPAGWSSAFIDSFWSEKAREDRLNEIFSFLCFVDFNGFATAAPNSGLKLGELIARLQKMKVIDERNKILEKALKGLKYWDWAALYASYKFHRQLYLNGIYWELCAQNPDIDAILMRRYRPNPNDRNTEQWVSWVKRHEEGYEIQAARRQTLRCTKPRGTSLALALSDYFVLGSPSLATNKPEPDAKTLEEPDTVALIPVYGTWLAGRGFGRVCAILQIAFSGQRDNGERYSTQASFDLQHCGPTETEKQIISHLLQMVEILAVDLTSAAIQRVVTERLSSHSDLSDAFVHGIQYLQDWEKVTFHVSGGSTRRRIYERCKPVHDGTRSDDDHSPHDGTTHGDPVADGCDSELHNPDKTQIPTCDELKSSCNRPVVLQWTSNKLSLGRNACGTKRAALHLNDVFSGIETGALNRPTSVSFLFPSNARLPAHSTREGAVRSLWRAYLNAVVRQQKELLSALAPRLIARRSALRTAVSAIMGRNMSHNIGSHVLARYSSAIKDDRDKTEDGKADHRGEFLAYLQRRMDFLAEIATSDKAFWAQALSLSDQVRCLNYDAQQERTGHASILLSRITGKETLRATVEFGTPQPTSDGYALGKKSADLLFSCPGGEVGVHSLFCILENVIRNSARHGNQDRQSEVRIFVCVAAEDQQVPRNDLIKILVVDPRTQLTSDGRVIGQHWKATGEASTATGSLEDVEAGEATTGDRKQAKLASLDKEINRILTKESLLNDDGSPNPNYWGVREMQICAHYLRGLPLSDLELQGDQQTPVLSAYVHELGGESFCLGYELYLPLAKLATVVVPAEFVTTQSSAIDGIKLVPAKPGIPWHEIANAARGYGFLVVDKEIAVKSGPIDTVARAELPVRMVEWEQARLSKLLSDALDCAPGETLWMEPLHEVIALEYRDKRTQWKDRSVWGVAMQAAEKGLKVPALGFSEVPEPGKMNWVPRDLDEDIHTKPLPTSWGPAITELAEASLGAAWIDHASPADLSSMRGAAFALAHKPSNEKKRMWACAEPAYSGSAHTAYLNESASADYPKCWEILAAALARVAVIDERVQSAATKDKAVRDIPLANLWASTGVWVPQQAVCDLDTPKLGLCRDFLRNPSGRREQCPIDFLVIHLTILERLRNENGKEHLGETLHALISDTEAAPAQIIIVTGRGVPTVAGALDADRLFVARYLPISALLECLITRPTKLGLMRALWSSSRPISNRSSTSQ